MSRRKGIDYQRDIGVDDRFQSETVQKLINVVMERGKKNVARSIVYGAIERIVKKMNGNEEKGLEVFYKGIDQLLPTIEVRARRVGGSVYQIPREVRPRRARALAMRWLIGAAAARPNKTMEERLAYELIDAADGRGNAVKKKLDVHRMADANRAFSHYSW